MRVLCVSAGLLLFCGSAAFWWFFGTGAASLDAVVRNIANEDGERTRRAIQYLEQTSTGNYYPAMEKLFQKGNETQRTMILKALMDTSHEAPAGYLDDFGIHFNDARSFREVDLMFRLMEKRNPASDEITWVAIVLLDHPEFPVANRAYRYLVKQSLSPAQQERLDAFQQ